MSSRVKPPTIHWGNFADGKLQNVEALPLSLPKPFFALDMEWGDSKGTIVFTYRSLRKKQEMDVAIAEWDGKKYVLRKDWQKFMANVNTKSYD